MAKRRQRGRDGKNEDLDPFREDPKGQYLTTDQGLRINDDQNSLKAGERGGSLLEDFVLREKITHFDHERIPERIVHARGAAAHGHFRVYKSLARYTTAGFLQDPAAVTPVFVRFSTVAGSRGSSDMARDARGFAVKFYTEQGNYDLVGNNIPVFFIQDAVKFPDLIHAVKPEPHNEIPQAALTKAGFLQDPSKETPVFVRFSTVAGSRGSTDLARDVRGFAVKFYTDEGVFDLVGNNIPVFFIQDAIKFPDLVHAVKPEPHNEMPQAASAHDTFWDFISLMPESMHMIMWEIGRAHV